MKIKQTNAAAAEKILDHDDKASTGGGGQKQPDNIILALKSEDFPALNLSKFDLYRPGDEGLDDFVVRPGEGAEDEAIYYGEE